MSGGHVRRRCPLRFRLHPVKRLVAGVHQIQKSIRTILERQQLGGLGLKREVTGAETKQGRDEDSD